MVRHVNYENWGATQSLKMSIFRMTEEEINKSIQYIETLLNSKKFKFDIKISTNRLKELSEQKEFLCQK